MPFAGSCRHPRNARGNATPLGGGGGGVSWILHRRCAGTGGPKVGLNSGAANKMGSWHCSLRGRGQTKCTFGHKEIPSGGALTTSESEEEVIAEWKTERSWRQTSMASH